MLDFLTAGRKLRLRTTVDDVHRLRPQPLCTARRVHGDVAAAHNGDLFRVQNGRLAVRLIRLHQVGARQVLVCGKHPFGALAPDAHKAGKARARAEKDRFKPVFVFQFIDRKNAPDDGIRLDLHAKRPEAVHFLSDDLLGQSEFGDPVDEHAARHVKRFKHGHVVAEPRQVSRAGEPRRPRTDDGDLVPVGLRPDRRSRRMRHVPIGDKPFQPADADRFALDAARALAFALRLLRADPAADGGQRRRAGDHLVRLFKLSLRHQRNESGNIHGHGTAQNTGLVFAVQAALCLVHGRLFVIAERDFLEIFIADKGLLRRHRMLLGIHIEFRHIRTPPFCRDCSAFRAPWLQTPHRCANASWLRRNR